METADITLVEGKPGNGKTTTGVGLVADDYFGKPMSKRPFVIANFHLYGIRHVYAETWQIAKWLNKSIMRAPVGRELWLVIDEAYIAAEARRGGNPLVLIMTWMGQQIRKRRIHLVIIVQNGRFIDWRLIWLVAKRITCIRKKGSPMIKLIVKDLENRTERTFRYNGSQYWKYFDTDELPPMPDYMVDAAVAQG